MTIPAHADEPVRCRRASFRIIDVLGRPEARDWALQQKHRSRQPQHTSDGVQNGAVLKWFVQLGVRRIVVSQLPFVIFLEADEMRAEINGSSYAARFCE